MEEPSLSVGIVKADQLHREKPRDWKTVLGIFYTPTPLAEALVEWAVTRRDQNILEPSFGGCGILNVIAARLLSLGATRPWENMYGCDKDPRAFRFLPEHYQNPGHNRQFLSGDFLRKTPTDFDTSGFDIVLGNPPYVCRRNLPRAQAGAATDAIAALDVRISARASLWVYFVLHSLCFLRMGGKIGWILPRSLSQSLYGKQLLRYLGCHFSTVGVISLGQRMFTLAGTDELTDVLVCDGYQKHPAHNPKPAFYYADSIEHLKRTLRAFSEPLLHDASADDDSLPPRAATLPPLQRAAFRAYQATLPARRLKELLCIDIGLVTGAVDFFIRRRTELKAHGLSRSDVQVVLAKFRHALGIEVRPRDCDLLFDNNEKVLLLKCSDTNLRKAVTAYLNRFPHASRAKIKTFAKRHPWHRVDDGKVADAFLPCLIRHGPRLVVNTARVTCTNNVLRVWFHEALSRALTRKAVALSLMSTFGQVSAELFGRTCGSGGLKLEPSDWGNVSVLVPDSPPDALVEKAFVEADAAWRNGRPDLARTIADDFLVATIPRLRHMSAEINQLTMALNSLRAGR